MKLIGLFCALFSLTIQINVSCTPPSATFTESNSPDFGQDVCQANSHCLPNGFCSCDVGYIAGCSQSAYRMQNGLEVVTQISGENYTFFQILGNTQTYTLLSFNLCLQDTTENTDFNIDVWDDNGTFEVLNKQNAQIGGKVWNVNNNCLTLSTPFMLFGTKTNGQPQGFILGVKGAQAEAVAVKMTVEITELDFWGLMVKIIFILGSCFLLVLSLAVAYIIYKWRRRRLFITNQVREKDIAHLDTYMPKMKLQPNQNVSLADELCSICLIELGDTHYLRRTVCVHVFHQECLDSWCKTHLSCPVCRRSFQLEDLKNGSETFDQTDVDNLRRNIL